MFLPIGDQPNPRGTPFVTYALIAVNVAIFVLVTLPLSSEPADPRDPRIEEYLDVLRDTLPRGVPLEQVSRQLSRYELVVFEYGYRPVHPSLLTLFTAMFLHGGFMHLFGNMLFLWIYGDNVEDRVGRAAFLFWYLVSGAAATLFHGLFASDSPVPLVGASGAISGVLGFYFLWFPKNKVRVLVFLFFFIRIFTLPARWVLGFYILVDNIFPFLVTASQGSGVAHGAHIGGFFTGLLVAFVLDRREVTERPAEYHENPRERAGPVGAAVVRAIDRGKLDEAARLYFNLPSARTRHLLTPETSLALGHWLARNGHARAALTVFQRHLRDYPGGPGAAEAHAASGLLQLHALHQPTAAYQHLVEALDYDPPPDLEATIRKALEEIKALQKFPFRRRH